MSTETPQAPTSPDREIPLPPEDYRRLVCGAGGEHLFEEVGRGACGWMRALGMLQPGARLLDVGCGCGRVARYLLGEPLASYVGFDRHPGMIDWCREHIATVDARFRFDYFELASGYEALDGFGGHAIESFSFPYADGSFDSVLLASVFTHMPMAEIDHYLGQLQRIVTPTGRILASLLLAEDKAYDNATDFWHRPADWLTAARKRGFDVEELTERGYQATQNYFLLSVA